MTYDGGDEQPTAKLHQPIRTVLLCQGTLDGGYGGVEGVQEEFRRSLGGVREELKEVQKAFKEEFKEEFTE